MTFLLKNAPTRSSRAVEIRSPGWRSEARITGQERTYILLEGWGAYLFFPLTDYLHVPHFTLNLIFFLGNPFQPGCPECVVQETDIVSGTGRDRLKKTSVRAVE